LYQADPIIFKLADYSLQICSTLLLILGHSMELN